MCTEGEVELETTGQKFIIKYDQAKIIEIPDDSPRCGKMSKATIHRGRFSYTVKTSVCGMTKIVKHIDARVAIKKYQEVDKDTVNYKRARENLEFLSLTGNKHPNFVRYFDHKIDNSFM